MDILSNPICNIIIYFQDGLFCQANSDCTNSWCDRNICISSLKDGRSCISNNQCTSSYCSTSRGNVCFTLVSEGRTCSTTSDCISSLKCVSATCQSPIAQGGEVVESQCSGGVAAICLSGKCSCENNPSCQATQTCRCTCVA